MLRLLTDANLDGNILRELLRRIGGIDVVRVQDVGLIGVDDPTVLAWAAEHGRVLVSHDTRTVTRYAFERVETGLPMPGVIEIILSTPIGKAIDDLALILEYVGNGELNGQVIYVPL